MGVQFFTVDRLPDFTMAKYSIQENGSVDDVVDQHNAFYRQLHRRGSLFGEYYSLTYWYDPERPAGEKIRMLFSVTGTSNIHMMQEFLNSTSLASSFSLRPFRGFEADAASQGGKDTASAIPPADEADRKRSRNFAFRSMLVKRSGMIPSSLQSDDSTYFVVDEWKPNDSGRLMGLFRLMRALNCRCAYSILLHPTDQTNSFRDGLQGLMKWMPSGSIFQNGGSQRDENAEKCRKIYNDLIDKLRGNPHFYCEISAFADTQAAAQLLLDSAAAEAVEEGNYEVRCFSGTYDLIDTAWRTPPAKAVKEELRFWPSLFMLDEVAPFAAFPTLYPGESIEIPKETAPIYKNTGLQLGKDMQGYDVFLPLELLPKHAFLAGVPGSGKTNTMMHLASQMAGKHQIPILVLEPAKQEYRELALDPGIKDLTVFSPAGSGAFPLRINPFEFPRGMKLSEHIVNLRNVFIGAFDLEPPMPFLLDNGIENVYRACGWYPFDYNDFDKDGNNIKPYPQMQMLFDEVEKLLEQSDYAPEVRSNLKTVLQVRIGSLISRETGNVFNVSRSTLRPEEWMEHSCVLELESLGKDGANFLTLLLATIIREYIKQNPKSDRSPRHVLFFEEAHNLIGPVTEVTGNSGNAKVASTKFIVDMLAEVRALKEAIVIADQLPTALAPQVTKNTSLKVGLRITAQDDREMLATTMSADGVQMEQMALFSPGRALCLYENVQKPFELQITQYAGFGGSPDNDRLYEALAERPTYRMCMERDFNIMYGRMKASREKLQAEMEEVVKADEAIQEELGYFLSLQDPKERELGRKKINQSRRNLYQRKRACVEEHIELVLAFAEYVRQNQLARKRGVEAMQQELEILMSVGKTLPEGDAKYPMDDLTQRILEALTASWDRIKVRRS